MKYNAIIFDLDGTLIDTVQDLTDCLNILFSKYNYASVDTVYTTRNIGNGARNLIKNALPSNTSDDRLDYLLLKYLEILKLYGSPNTRFYPDIENMLDALTADGVKIAIFSNKPDQAVQKILKYFFADKNIIALGEGAGFPPKPDPGGVCHIMELLGADSKNTLFVGDSDTDIKTAKNANLTSVAVTWGYRPIEVLKKETPDYIVSSAAEILKICMQV